jgi:hypothetical protein
MMRKASDGWGPAQKCGIAHLLLPSRHHHHLNQNTPRIPWLLHSCCTILTDRLQVTGCQDERSCSCTSLTSGAPLYSTLILNSEVAGLSHTMRAGTRVALTLTGCSAIAGCDAVRGH